MQVKKQQLKLDKEQHTQNGKGVHKGCILSPGLFNLYAEYIMQTAGWINHKLESRLLGEITTLDMQMIPLMAESEEELKKLLMKVKEESGKAGLKLNIQKTNIIACSPITLWQIDVKKLETVADFILLGSKKSLQMVNGAMKLKDPRSLDEKL